MQLIGRERELSELNKLKESLQPEFVVLYGRRRVGKTFLVLSFERLCFAHIYQIQRALGISGIATQTFALRTASTQIDMVIDRADDIVNLCEMKYTTSAYVLTKSESEKIQNRIEELSGYIGKKSIITVLISNSPAKNNEYYNQFIYNNLTLKDLFF